MIRLLCFCLCLSLPVFGAAEVSPKVRALLDNMEEAQGGKKAFAKVKSIRMVMEGEMPAMGLKMIITTVSTWDKVRVDTVIPGAMTSVQAFDGKNAWSKDLLMGLRELKDAEKTSLRAASLQALRKPELVYDSIRIDGTANFQNRECIKLVVSNKGEKNTTIFVDAKTYLALGSEAVQVSPQGELKVTSVLRDYKKAKSGSLYPSSMSIATGPMQIEGKITTYEENVPLDDKLFAKPAAETTGP